MKYSPEKCKFSSLNLIATTTLQVLLSVSKELAQSIDRGHYLCAILPVISLPPRPASRTHKHAQRRTTKSQSHGTRPV